jgi:HNH endonuclease
VRPGKPFDSYKWRWLSVAPTEGLLDPPVLLGVLRVLAKHDGQAPSLPVISKELGIVGTATQTQVNLGRTGERNLIRNSGQYWKGLGLINPTRGKIALTPLGKRVANSELTQSEFAAIMVEQTVLPNPWTYSPGEIEKWNAAGLKIRPLALILEIINILESNNQGGESGYLSPEELVKVVIPLVGEKVATLDIASFVIRYRCDKRIVAGWPNCAPDANDERLAREFLLFLGNFGFLRVKAGGSISEEKYFLDQAFDVQWLGGHTTASIFTMDSTEQARVIRSLDESELPSIIERQRVLANVLSRPQQAKFREDILRAYEGRCLISGEAIPSVLEAAHIVPVKNNGADLVDNGFCLRVDIHRLYDSGNIRIDPNGNVRLTGMARSSVNYGALRNRVSIPSFVKHANLQWRHAYL